MPSPAVRWDNSTIQQKQQQHHHQWVTGLHDAERWDLTDVCSHAQRNPLIIMCEHVSRRGCDCSLRLCHRSMAMCQGAKLPCPHWLDWWCAACCWAEHVKAICSGWQVFFAADKLLCGSDGTPMRPTSSRIRRTLSLASVRDDCFARICWKSVMQKGGNSLWFEDYIWQQPNCASLIQW